MRHILLSVVVILSTTTSVRSYAFAPATFFYSGINGGSNFVVSQRPRTTIRPTNNANTLQMGSMAKFGVFSPTVYAAKFVLGEKKLNNIRGKAISLHSQAIGDFCEWAGAYHLRTKLIKKAKTNGDTLGFLV